MTTGVFTTPPQTPVAEAAAAMVRGGFGSAVVFIRPWGPGENVRRVRVGRTTCRSWPCVARLVNQSPEYASPLTSN